MGIAPDDVNLGAIPFSHSYGFSNLVTPLLLQGTPIVISNDYLPQSMIELANRYRCTVAPLIPMVFEHLASSAAHGEFDTVRTFISAGAPLPASTSRRFRERSASTSTRSTAAASAAASRTTAAAARSSAERSARRWTAWSSSSTTRASRSAAPPSPSDISTMRSTFQPFDGTFRTDDLVEVRDDGEIVADRAAPAI